MDDTLNSTSRMLGPSESEALVEAGDAVDALFHWVNSDKLKLADLFNRIDKDNSGALEKDEFAMCMTMLGVPVEERHLDAMMLILDVDGDGDVVISEFFERMEMLHRTLIEARKRQVKREAEGLKQAAHLRAMQEAQGTATSAFLTLLRARAGVGPGVTAPTEWNRVDCDGERGVLPARKQGEGIRENLGAPEGAPWELPPGKPSKDGKTWKPYKHDFSGEKKQQKGRKRLKELEKKVGVGWWAGSGSAETAGWVPPLSALVTEVCTPTIPKVSVEFSEDDLKQYFTTLKLESQGITKIDRFFPGFSNVEELSLSGNAISTIENLPASLRQLNLSTNSLTGLPSLGPLAAQLHQISLSYNRLSDETTDLTQGLTALVSLDLSHNKLCDLAALLPKLAALPKLKHLYLDGNPFCLRKQYRAAVIAALPELTMLDGVEVDVDQKELAEAYAAPEPDPPPAPPAPEEGEEAAPAPEAPARRVPVLAGLGSDAVELTVGLSDLTVIASPSWPQPPPPVEEGEEPVEPEVLDLAEYSYQVRYRLPGLSAVDGETEAAALEAAEGVTWLEEESAGKAVGSAALGHSAPCGVTADVQTRDVLSHTRLSLELWERRRMPPAEGEEGDGEEGEAVRIGVGVAVVTGGEDDVTPPAVEGVGLESLPEAAATSLCGALPSPHRRASSQLATCCLAALVNCQWTTVALEKRLSLVRLFAQGWGKRRPPSRSP